MAASLESPASAGTTQDLFLTSWQVYRKMVDNDYLFHRDAYGCLRDVLIRRLRRPFRFLDVACGDASMSLMALRDTAVCRYTGVDISAPALEIAAGNLAQLDCEVALHQGSFSEVLANWPQQEDIVWIGLSLHHLLADGKAEVMADIRRIVGDGGRLLIYEDTCLDGESREQWLTRWDAQKPLWTAYSEAEWDYVTAHVHSSDFPETDETWRALGRAAGFARVDELYRSPTALFRLYAFDA